MTTIPLSRAQGLIRPFVGHRHRYEVGAQSIDIIARGVEYGDAKVLEMTGEGVRVRNAFGAVMVPWADVRAVRLRTLDRHGRWSDGARFDLAAAADRRAA